jgi:phage terminase large subunit-like protein
MTAIDRKTWQRWRDNPIEFIERVLYDPETKQPFRLLPAEREFLKHAFMLDENGRLLYPEQVYACPKKSGKTTFAAIHGLTVILLFGSSYPEAVCVANDYEQALGRVFTMMRRIVECSPLLREIAKITADKIVFAEVNGSVIAIPSDFAGAAGGNQNIAIFDELWGTVSERARRLFDEMVPPPTRKIALRLTVTYAGFEGESVLLEELYRRGLQQPSVGPDLHAGEGLLLFWSHEPIAPWQTESWLSDMRRSLRPNQYLRMIENRFVTTESSFIDMDWWDACVDPNNGRAVSNRGLAIWVGVDASVKRDSTGIVATTWDYKAQKVRLVQHKVFQPSPDEPLDFEDTIEATLLDLRSRFRVVKVLYDPYQMAATAQRLQRLGVPLEEFPQTVPNLTAASQNLYELIQGGNLAVYPDAAMRLAVSRAVAVETPRGWRIAKEKQSHKIDVVVALAMAAHACVEGQTSAPMNVEAMKAVNARLAAMGPYRPVFGGAERRQYGIGLGERQAAILQRSRGF